MADQDLDYTDREIGRIRQEYLEIVDTMLLAVSGRTWELEHVIAPHTHKPARTSWQQEELRSSPLGQALLTVADYASGSFLVPITVERAMKRVYRALFGDSLSDGFRVPPTFYKSALGKLFHTAYTRLYRREDLLTPVQVYRSLGVARQTVYDRMYEGKLTPISFSGELRFLRSEVEAWQGQRAQRRNVAPGAEQEEGPETV